MGSVHYSFNLSICLVLITVTCYSTDARLTPYHLENNEVTYHMDERAIQTPICGENAVCGYVQANAKGINQQRFCACGQNLECPMAWDEDDGHSITQGSDQYKFCRKVDTLPKCDPGSTAYKSRTIFSKTTGEKLNQLDHVECFCPKTHSYELANQHFGDLDTDSEVMDVSYSCSPLPICGAGDICKMISETQETYLVNRKCQCPAALRCPTLSRSKHDERLAMGAGFIHAIHCQA